MLWPALDSGARVEQHGRTAAAVLDRLWKVERLENLSELFTPLQVPRAPAGSGDK